jgi:S1-C subfamily serine protease
VAAALLALVSALIGGVIQGWVARDVEAEKSQALLSVEGVKAKANIDLEVQRQRAAERLDRAKFETTLILKAIEATKREDQIRNLKFFLNAGFIGDQEGKIAKIDEAAYPSLPPPVASTPGDFYRDYKGAVGVVEAVGPSPDGNHIRVGGTTFVINKDGYALTAAHLFSRFALGQDGKIETQISVSLGSQSGSRQLAELIKLDKDFDLALIKLTGNVEYPRIKISREEVLIAESITAMGYPFGKELTVVLGTVSSIEQNGRIGMALPTSPGQAGSPVFNKSGDVVGILVSSTEGRILALQA